MTKRVINGRPCDGCGVYIHYTNQLCPQCLEYYQKLNSLWRITA